MRTLGPDTLDAVVGNTKKLAPSAARPAPLASASTNALAAKAAPAKTETAQAKPAREEKKAEKKGKGGTLDWSKAK